MDLFLTFIYLLFFCIQENVPVFFSNSSEPMYEFLLDKGVIFGDPVLASLILSQRLQEPSGTLNKPLLIL